MSQFDFNSLLASVFEWTWKTSLSGTVVIGLVVLIQVLFRKILPPRWSYALWLLAVLRLMLPNAPSSSFSVFNLGDGLESHFPIWRGLISPAHQPELNEPTPNPSQEGNKGPGDRSPPGRGWAWVYGRESSSHPEPLAPLPAQLAEKASRASPVHTLLAIAPWVWLIGASGYFLTVLIRHSKLACWVRRQRRSSNAHLQALVEDSKAVLGVGRDIDLIESSAPGTAAIFGFFRPRLLLSKSILERLDTQELRLVILHELIHVRRRDVLLNWLLIALQSLHWFNPAVWLALKRLKADRELVCDAEVMAKLAAEDRHAYGNTLIKLLDDSAALAPSLVPIINHKHEIQRRIIMIAQFKPTSRIVSFASAMLLLALGCFTFTRATEKNPPSPAAGIPKAESELEKQRNTQERGLKILEEEWTKQDKLVRKKRQELDQLKVDLQIMDPEEPGDRPNTADLEVIRKLESTRIEALADFKRIDTLYRSLTNLTRAEFSKAVVTASPDQQLVSLLEQRALSEQKLEDLLASYHPDHPDVKRLNSVLAKIHIQIDDRLDGILNGLKIKREAEKARLHDLQTALSKYKTSHIESAIKLGPYLEANRNLESLHQVRERLTLRILQEKVDAAILQSAPRPKRTFTILGQVQKPGVYEIAGETKMNLLQALATAGGPTDKGNSQKVTVLRPAENKNLIFNLNAEHMAKDEQPIFQILPGDIITVPAKVF